MQRSLNEVVGIHERGIPTIGYLGEMPEIVAIPNGYNQCVDTLSSFQMDSEELAKIMAVENLRIYKERGIYPVENELAIFVINQAHKWIIKKQGK